MKKQFTFKGNTIEVSGLKRYLSALENLLGQVLDLPIYTKTLTGIKDEDERSSLSFQFPRVSNPLRDPEGWLEKATELFNGLDGTKFDDPAYQKIRPEISGIINTHVFILDQRKTRTEKETENTKHEETRKVMAERQAQETAKYLAEFADSNELIPIPVNSRAVVIKTTYDDSDVMSDYFAPNRSTGNTMLLGIIPEGRENEASLRNILNKFSELQGISFEWYNQKYSMGHGNYLKSTKAVGSLPIPVYRIGSKIEDTPISFEIRHDSHIKNAYPFRGYAEAHKSRMSTPSTQDGKTSVEVSVSENKTGVEINFNEDKNGIEIKFEGRPDQEILDKLKSHRFRWSRRQKMWYTRYNESAKAFAESLTQ